jgi:malate dehydrogenase (oxaloacetate-decarboxylating)
MMIAAARTLAELSPAIADPGAPLLPAFKDIRSRAVEIAIAAAREAQSAATTPPLDATAPRSQILSHQWTPAYPDYLAADI